MNSGSIKTVAIVFFIGVSVAGVALLREARSRAAPPSQPADARGGLPRMVDLGADACIPCKQMAPILAELKVEYAGRATIEFIDVWKDPDANKQYGVRVIPTQIFYDTNSREVWRHEGFLPKADIVARLKELGAG